MAHFTDNMNGVYTLTHTVVFGESDRTPSTVPASIVLIDAAGNSNAAYTTLAPNALAIKGSAPASVTQAFPSFSANGKFTQDVILDCTTDSGYFEMYYVRDSDSTFGAMNISGSTVSCSDGSQTFVSSGFGFEDFLGYAPVAGWYYGIVSIGYPNCAMAQNDTICASNKLQSFFRLHRNDAGVWSDTGI